VNASGEFADIPQVEREIMDTVIDLHYLAGRVIDPATAAHIRAVADALNGLAFELRSLSLVAVQS
jgi:hypothetical protein